MNTFIFQKKLCSNLDESNYNSALLNIFDFYENIKKLIRWKISFSYNFFEYQQFKINENANNKKGSLLFIFIRKTIHLIKNI